MSLAKSRGKNIELDGIVIYPNNRIGIKESYLDHSFNLSSALQYLLNIEDLIERANKNLGLKKNRCLLHSKKPVPICKLNFIYHRAMEGHSAESTQIQ